MISNKVKKNNRLIFAIFGFSLMTTTGFAGQNWNKNGQNWKNQQSDNNNQMNNRQSGNEAIIKKLKDLGYWDNNAKLIAQEMERQNVNALKAVKNLNDRRGKGDEIPIHHEDKLEDIK